MVRPSPVTTISANPTSMFATSLQRFTWCSRTGKQRGEIFRSSRPLYVALRLLYQTDQPPDWFALLSGADYPIKPAEKILEDLQATSGRCPHALPIDRRQRPETYSGSGIVFAVIIAGRGGCS